MADHTVVAQQWEESERNWGIRPDGYSLHMTEDDRLQYIADYWAAMPATAPAEYSRPCGRAYFTQIPDSVYRELVEAKDAHGARFYHNNQPSYGGMSGGRSR